jgi:hypothetical protein
MRRLQILIPGFPSLVLGGFDMETIKNVVYVSVALFIIFITAYAYLTQQ